MAAPTGNQNAAKGREWTDAIRWALENYESKAIKRGQALRQIAQVTIEKAIDGDKDARQEIGNRLDGKPVQPTELSGTGANGEILGKLTVEFVDPTASKG